VSIRKFWNLSGYKDGEEWFEPVFNMLTPLFPPLSPQFHICSSSTQKPPPPKKKLFLYIKNIAGPYSLPFHAARQVTPVLHVIFLLQNMTSSK